LGITIFSNLVPITRLATWLASGARIVMGTAAAKEGTTLVDDVARHAKEWLGKDYKVIINKAGDDVFMSKDRLRKIRFDIRNPTPHKNPHVHLEQLINGKWKGVRIYPKDVPHY
jgi:hypothetical protein